MSLPEIDFARLYREHMQRANRPERPPEHWNDRAPAMSQRTFDTDYVRQFLGRLDLTGCATLLDVGCGPGTISLSVARDWSTSTAWTTARACWRRSPARRERAG
jgi:cyclopropane fatty-acyl-phospholipid synthase-like methyltransferase